MDWHTRTVLAWCIPNRLEADFCAEALNEAVHRCGPAEIIKSDQSAQFTSFAWTDRLKRIAPRISIEGKGRCRDNIFIERLWRSLKDECVGLHALETGSQAKAAVGGWIMFCNDQRPHATHGRPPPAVVCCNQIEIAQQGQRAAYTLENCPMIGG